MMVRAQGLTKRYGAVVAVDDLTFDVERGETFALIGPNGAGKTTTLRLLLGLTRPDAGTLSIGEAGLPPSAPAARHDLGYVPQRVEFPSGRTVAEVLRFFAELRGLDPGTVSAVLDRVGLAPVAARRASELSGGYTQRLSLAQALLADPALLVLDEPTASLDPEATWEFRALVLQLQRQGKTILLCSHLLSEVERVANRVLIMVDGRRAALERLDTLREQQARATRLVVDLLEEPARALAVLGRAGLTAEARSEQGLVVEASNGHGLAALDALRAAQVPIRTFEMLRPTLEETFMSVVRSGGRHA